jgi:hypothetical protein
MVAGESEECRKVSTSLASANPEKTVEEFIKIRELNLPGRHPVLLTDIKKENLKKILEKTYERKPESFEALLSINGVGPKTIRALALMSELIYSSPFSLKDPVRFSFAHGGKDGFPYPVDKKGYDLSIQILHDAVNKAKIGRIEKLGAFKRLRIFYS